MQIHQTSKRRPLKIVLLIIVLLLLLVGGWLFWTHHYQKWPFLPPTAKDAPVNTVDYGTPSNQQTSAGASTKAQVAEQAKQQETQTGTTSTTTDIPVTITAVQPGDTVMVRAIVQSVTSSATCRLDMSGPSGKTYTATAGTQALAESSTCQGFNIPMSALAAGTWRVTITVTDGSHSGTATAEKTL